MESDIKVHYGESIMSFGRYGVDWERRINIDRMRKERLERARKTASSHGADAMLVLDGENIRYLGYNVGRTRGSGARGFRYMIFPLNQDPILFEFGKWYPYTKDSADWLDVRSGVSILPEGPPEAKLRQNAKAAGQIKKALVESGLKTGNVLVDANNPMLAKALKDEGIQVNLGASEILHEARLLKTPDEVECLRLASSIAEGGYEKLGREIRPGVSETELKGKFVGELYRLGIEYVPTGEVTSGYETYNSHNITSDRLVRHGDLVIGQACSSSYLGYRVCYYRTFAAGHATQAAKDAYAHSRDILNEAIKLVRPGVTTKDIAEKWPKAKEFGYEDEDQAIWVQWGHGIGLGIPEEPTFSRLWSLEFPERIEKDMLLALETWIPTSKGDSGYPKGQSVRLEQMMRVTDSGTELISKFPMDELIICR